MSLGPVLSVAIGLIMTFAVMALVVSSAVRALTTLLQTRSSNLRDGIATLLNDTTMTGLAGKLFTHAAIHPLGDGAQVKPDSKGLPSYIGPQQFASVLVELIQNPDPASKLELKEAIDKIDNVQIRTMLSGAYDRASGDVSKLHQELAGWFDRAMDHVKDNFQRKTQKWSFCIALILALGLNVDSFHIAQAIWANPEMVAAIEELGQSDEESMSDLAVLATAGFPMGWNAAQMQNVSGWAWASWGLAKLVGCLFTALAAMLGAPFWFGLLAQIRGSAPATPPPSKS